MIEEARSSGRCNRPVGIRFVHSERTWSIESPDAAACSAKIALNRSVSTAPGQTQFTVIPSLAASRDSVLERGEKPPRRGGRWRGPDVRPAPSL